MYELQCPTCETILHEKYIMDRWDYPLCKPCATSKKWKRKEVDKDHYCWVRTGTIVDRLLNWLKIRTCKAFSLISG